MAVNFVSSSSVCTTTAQTVQNTARSIQTSNSKFSTSNLDDREGRLLRDLVAVFAPSPKQDTTKVKQQSAICSSRSLLEKCVPEGLHLAVASLNVATKDYSSLVEKIMPIADSHQDNDHITSNNFIVNKKEKTERIIYIGGDDITLDDNSEHYSRQTSLFQRNSVTNDVARDEYGNFSNNNKVAEVAICFPTTATVSIDSKNQRAPNESVTKDYINPRGSTLEEKLDKLLDSVVKIKADMYQKIDRLSRRVDQIKLDVQLNIDTTDRAICNNVLELAGVPYLKDENLQLYFRKMCSVLGYLEEDIPMVDVRRRQVDRTIDKTESQVSTAIAINKNTSTSCNLRTAEGSQYQSVIIIEFVFKTMRDAFYRAYLKKRTIQQSDIGLQSDRRIYINESLTKLNQKLKSVALKKKREGLLHAVYTLDGAIYVQQHPGQKGRRISSVADLEWQQKAPVFKSKAAKQPTDCVHIN